MQTETTEPSTREDTLLGKRVELVVHLKDQFRRLRAGDRGTVTAQFRDGFNVPLQVSWDNGARWSVHYDEVRFVDENTREHAASPA